MVNEQSIIYFCLRFLYRYFDLCLFRWFLWRNTNLCWVWMLLSSCPGQLVTVRLNIIDLNLGILEIALVYGAAQYGQYKGKEQMEELRGFLGEMVEGS